MSRKRDPVLVVVRYFQEAELPLAEQALSLAQSIVRGRRSGPAKQRLRAAAKQAKPLAAVGSSSE